MTLQLYNIWLQDGATATAEDEIRADIQQAGFVGQGGTASERVSAESIDLTVTGQFRLGDVLSKKLAVELDSLGASAYEAVPLYDDEKVDRKRKYYHVAQADTQPAHQTTDGTFEYTVALSEAGTRQDNWRATRTGSETVQTDLTAGDNPRIAVDAQAGKVRWFDPADGTESATLQTTVAGEGGGYDLYDPTEPSFDDPILLYEVAFSAESETDTIVYDDRNVAKTLTFASAGGFQYDTAQYDTVSYEESASATQWHHVFHEAYEFEGRPVVDTGRLRVRFDESAGTITAYQFTNGAYFETAIDQGDYELFDADIEVIGPTDVRVFTEWEDTTDGSIDAATLSFQRGIDEVLVRAPPGASNVVDALEDVLDAIALGWDTDPTPSLDLVRRTEVKGT
jgi:hypothetical protein